MKKYLNKKGISPIISILLLIVVLVAIVTIILNWGKAFTQDQTQEISDFKEFKSIKGHISITSIHKNTLTLYNNHKMTDLNIIGYKLRVDDENLSKYGFHNILIDLNNTVNLQSKSEAKLELVCLPSTEFDLDLYTSNNKYVSLEVETDQMVSPMSCLNYGLVGHWDFKDIGSLILEDKSGNGNDGTVNGATVSEFWAEGNGKGVFDGVDDYVNCGANEILTLENSDFSWSGWTYLNNWNTTHSQNSIITRGGSSDTTDGFRTAIYNDGKIWTTISDGTDRTIIGTDIETIQLNKWYFISITYNRDENCRIYVNGDKNKETDITNSYRPISTHKDLYLGVYTPTTRPLDGIISDLKIWNRTLSSQEVKDLYDLTKGRYQ